ncbi:cyclase family protein [Klebsiella indica]|uniref:Cyclase family protein n=2 Tax=Klebsiella indica TaxID=2582917 RepID=A0A5R9LD30_9ENTR|nr:cyclase family protein [Klebsiella indica]
MCVHQMTASNTPCQCAVDDALLKLRSMRAVDLAPRLERGIPRWPTHPHFFVDPTIGYEHDGYYCQSLVMPEHIGCHVDAPAHVSSQRKDDTIDTLPVDALVASATVYDFSDREWKPGDLLTADDIEAWEKRHGCAVRPGDIALVNFGWLRDYWRRDSRAQWYATNSPGMNEDVAILFKERGVIAVGADTIACEGALVEGKIVDMPGHQRHWLPNGILILESVANMEQLSKQCLFVASALPIARGSGSPLRPIAYCPDIDH